MKNEQIIPLLNTISELGNIEITDLDTALAMVENQEKLTNAHRKNSEALNKVVVFTDAEKDFSKQLTEAENQKEFIEKNKAIADSIREKNKRRDEFEKVLMEKEFKVDLQKIDKKNLLDKKGNLLEGIKLKHIAALKPIIK